MNGQPVEDLLVEFSTTGQQQVFEEIVRRYAGLVFGVCLRTCKDAHDAEDATQAVFLALAVQCKSGNTIRHLPAWLRQVAKRTSLDVRKARKRREAREARRSAENNGIINDGDDGRPSAMDLQEIGHVLSEELAKLPAKYRLPLVSLYFGGLSREEIADQLGLKPGALGVRIHRARAMLGDRLKRRGAYPEGTVLAIGMAPMLDNAFGGALTLRTAEAAARVMLGHDLSGAVSGNVLSLMNGTAGAITLGRLKVVASVLLLIASAASGGGMVVKSTDAVPQAVAQVRQWITQIRNSLTLPSLDLRADADDAGTTTDSLSERDRLALAPVEPQFQFPALPGEMTTSSQETIGGSSSSAPSAVGSIPSAVVTNAPPTPPGGIRFPEVYVSTAPRSVAQPPAGETKKPAETTAQTGATGRLAAGGGAPAAPITAGAQPAYVASSSGSVTMSDTPSESSRWLDSRAGKRPTVPGRTLAVGKAAGSKGTYTLDSGTLVAGTESIGEAGHGTFVQNGGTNVVTQVVLADASTGTGIYQLNAGSIQLNVTAKSDFAPGMVVGGEGKGELYLGNQINPGYVTFAPVTATVTARPTFLIRAAAMGSGVVRGWGQVNGGGNAVLVNNGQAIADGFGKDRDLSFPEFSYVDNTIDNSASHGTNGWFASNGGQLTMAAVPSGNGTFTWGESITDATLDMVNSARLTISPPPEHVDVSLLATDRSDIPALPAGHTFIGVWKVDMGDIETDRISLSVRYDDAQAAALGLDESALKLWRYDGSQWQRVTGKDFWRNTDANLIGGRVDSLQYFAVSAPEPTGLVTIAALGAGMLLRRRRRR